MGKLSVSSRSEESTHVTVSLSFSSLSFASFVHSRYLSIYFVENLKRARDGCEKCSMLLLCVLCVLIEDSKNSRFIAQNKIQQSYIFHINLRTSLHVSRLFSNEKKCLDCLLLAEEHHHTTSSRQRINVFNVDSTYIPIHRHRADESISS